MTIQADFKNRILDYLTDHRDVTSIEIAQALGENYGAVQIAICYLVVDQSVIQTGKRQVEDGRVRPTYAAAPLSIPWHLIRRVHGQK